MSDIQLTAAVDFTGAKKDVDSFVKDTQAALGKLATETAKVAKSLSAIRAASNAPGGSNSRPGTSSTTPTSPTGRTTAVDAYNQLVAQERRYQAALSRTDSMIQRIDRQGDGNAQMIGRARSALDAYTTTLRNTGTRSLETARAHGTFAREMGALNSELARTNGLLPTLNRGFGSVVSTLSALSPAAGSAARNIGTISTGLRAAALGAGAAIGVVGGVALGFAAIGAAAITAGAAMAKPVDSMNLLVGKLNAATGSMAQAKVLYAETVAIANRLGTSVGDVGTAMARFAGVGKDIGLANADVSGLTETFLKLGKVSGQTAQEAAASLTQLSQALASGRLQGDEYRSLAENMPALTREIATMMGVTTGELKGLASEGTVTTDIVLKALRNMTAQVNADFATIPRTVEQINAGISNQWDQLLINLDDKLHLSDLYKFFLQLPEKALQAANNFLAGPKPQERATDLQSQINTLDSQIARNPFGWMRKGLQNQRAELVKELDGIQTDMLRSAVETGEQAISADERAWQQRVDTAKRGAADLRKANDPVFKANEEYQDSLKKLNQSKPFISGEDYKAALDAITQTRDAAIERANKSTNALTVEEKAVWRTEVAYSALRMELANAKVATEALSMGDMTVLDTKALERTVDFLTNFAKQAKIVPTTLEDLAQRAGVSLKELQAGFRAIEAETLKLQALKRSKDLGIETEETKRLANATLEGADAYAKVSREIEVERQLRALGLDAKDKDLASTREEIRLKLEAVEASREYAKAAQEGQSILERYGDGDTRLRLGLEKLNSTYRTLAESGRMTPELNEAFGRAAQDLAKQTKTVEGAFYRAFDSIGDAWGDLFDKMLDGGKVTFRDFAGSLKNIFTKALAEMAYIAIARPVIVPQNVAVDLTE